MHELCLSTMKLVVGPVACFALQARMEHPQHCLKDMANGAYVSRCRLQVRMSVSDLSGFMVKAVYKQYTSMAHSRGRGKEAWVLQHCAYCSLSHSIVC
jgi:hypothetical protein